MSPKSMQIACVIPARLKSVRFPKKILSSLGEKPLLQWAWEGAVQSCLFDSVIFAIDSLETARVIDSFGGRWIITSPDCPSGTMRLVELEQKGLIQADIFVNWQADEPFIHKKMIEDLLQSCLENDADVWTLKKRVSSLEDAKSAHIPKVVTDSRGYALYFSRACIPHYRDETPFENQILYKHIGLYAYTKSALKKIGTLPSSQLEEAEKLEQLSFLYHGLKIKVHTTDYEVLGVDLPEHLEKAERYLAEGCSKKKS